MRCARAPTCSTSPATPPTRRRPTAPCWPPCAAAASRATAWRMRWGTWPRSRGRPGLRGREHRRHARGEHQVALVAQPARDEHLRPLELPGDEAYEVHAAELLDDVGRGVAVALHGALAAGDA